MSTVWRIGSFLSGGTGPNWGTSEFGSQDNAIAVTLNVGETVLRTRLETHIVLGMSNSSPSTTVSDLSILGATQIDMGLYCNPAVAVPYGPQAANASVLDGHWLQLNTATLHSTNDWEDASGVLHMHGNYKFDSGTSQSFAQRGPCTAASGVYLAWFFDNVFTPFWAATGPPLAGEFGIRVRASVLVKLP